MALQVSVVSVTTTATRLTSTSADYGNGLSISLHPAAAIFVGPAGVTAATGYPIGAGADFALDLEVGEDLYGITASGTSSVNVLQTGL